MPAGCSPVRQVSANVHLLFFFVPSACFPAEGLLNFLGISGECASFLGCELWFFEDGGGIGKVDQRKFFATYRLQALVGHGRSKRENLVPAEVDAWDDLLCFPHFLADHVQSVRKPRRGVEKLLLWAGVAKSVQVLAENANRIAKDRKSTRLN